MTEWLLLFIIVPAIVVPVVLLFGFAGCGFEGHGIPLPEPPIILSASGKSLSTITLTWMAEASTATITFERTRLIGPTLVGPPVTFSVPASPATHDDGGLDAATTYQYAARAVVASGDMSERSAPVRGSTLAPPTFDAKGTGNTATGTTSASTTWSHTASGDLRAVIVGLRWADNGLATPGATPTRTANYGGTAMTSLGVLGLNNAALTDFGNAVYQEFFGLLDPPTGAQTISVTVNRPGIETVTIAGCSASYTGVTGFGAVTSVFGTEAGTSLAQTVNSAVNEMVVQMFSTATGTVTGYNQTVRFDGSANGIGFVIGDAPGAPSVSFTASRAGGVDYAGQAVRLAPRP